MESRKKLRLSILLIVLAMILTFMIATFDYLRHKQSLVDHHMLELNQIEENVIDAITTVEKAYALLGEQTVTKMEEKTEELIHFYEETPTFDDWDFDALLEDKNKDIYIINDKNVITHSSLASDIGMDFTACCKSLSDILNERRASGEFFVDQMDMEQKTGMIRMYSYMATPDRKYIIQLGYNLQEDDIFQAFNFLDVIDEQLKKYPFMHEINVLNLGGYVLGKSVEERDISKERKAANKEALSTRTAVEFEDDWKDATAMYRYIPYTSSYDEGSSKEKSVEIVYDDSNFQAILSRHRTIFVLQLVTVSIIIGIISIFIHRWVAKQVYFAYHDGLTHLKNRTAFDDAMANVLLPSKRDEEALVALMMIDLDNFKPVNDYLGHDQGDYLLRLIGQSIQAAVAETGDVFRIGGDEFAVILSRTTKRTAINVANRIIQQVEESTLNEKKLSNFNITGSIGISFSPDHGTDYESLYKCADIALYHAKEEGKSQYSIYDTNVRTVKNVDCIIKRDKKNDML